MTDEQRYVKSWELAVTLLAGLVSVHPEEAKEELREWQVYFYERLKEGGA